MSKEEVKEKLSNEIDSLLLKYRMETIGGASKLRNLGGKLGNYSRFLEEADKVSVKIINSAKLEDVDLSEIKTWIGDYIKTKQI